MSQKAVIDRFEGDFGIVIIGEGEGERQVDVPKKALPKGAREGDWLQVEMSGDQITSARDRQRGDGARQAAHRGKAGPAAQRRIPRRYEARPLSRLVGAHSRLLPG